MSVFLSHSGFQKPFVERLKDALQAAGHSPFFDVISLPKAEPFPPHIEEALQKCKLGVVVLSQEFMMSHWPMRELALLHHNRPSAKIFPLFYELSPHDLRCEQNLAKWRPKWAEIGKECKLDTSHWEELVRMLPRLNGEVFKPPRLDEASYIHKVVKEICRLVPLSPPNDVHGVKGGSRLCQIVMDRFQAAQSTCKSISSACTIGLHGVGGAGKTTVCKLMANAYSSQYPGKSLWLEFPSDGNKTSIAEECKKLLRRCTNASDEHVLKEATSVNEIFPELDKRMREHACFLAIDNIWESTLEDARRLLEVKFHKESKILFTSRSKAVLKDLLKGCDTATCIDAVPSMEWEEAFRLFEMSFDHNLSSVPHHLADGLLRLCLFEGSYHPLALKALGKMLRRMQADPDGIHIKEVEASISRLSLNLVDATIETLIRTNYDTIPTSRQHMFLDIVVVFLSPTFECFTDYKVCEGSYNEVQKGLRILYANEQHSNYDNIDVEMRQLALDGLLDFEGIDDDRRIVVHDLYLDLAERVARASSRFFLGRAGCQLENRDWSMVKRFILNKEEEEEEAKEEEAEEEEAKEEEEEEEEGCIFSCLQSEVLIAVASRRSYGQVLQVGENMGALRILLVRGFSLGISTSSGSISTSSRMHGRKGCVGRLAWLQVERCIWYGDFRALHEMDRLEVVILRCVTNSINELVCLRLCSANLQVLEVHSCPDLQEIRIFGSLKLQKFVVGNCKALKKINLMQQTWRPLHIFQVFQCECLEEIKAGSHDLMNLKSIDIHNCPLLKAIPALTWATKYIEIHSCKSLEEIKGSHDLMNIKSIYIFSCRLLKAIPALSGATECIEIVECGSLEEIKGSHDLMNLKSIHITACPLLKAIPALTRATEVIQIHECESLEEIEGSHDLMNLKAIDIFDCPLLKAIPALTGAAKYIKIHSCESLEEIKGSHDLVNIKSISISSCPLLKAIPALSGATEYIQIGECGSLEEIKGSHNLMNLKSIHIFRCPLLKAIPALTGATEDVQIYECGSLEEIKGSHDLMNLKSIDILNYPLLNKKLFEIVDCPLLKAIPALNAATKIIRIERCGSLEEIPASSGLINLKGLYITDCPCLKAILLDLRGAIQLESIKFKCCEFLEKIPTLHVGLTNLEKVSLIYCPHLNVIPDLSGTIEFKHIGNGFDEEDTNT